MISKFYTMEITVEDSGSWWDGVCKTCGSDVEECSDEIERDYKNRCINPDCYNSSWHSVYDSQIESYYYHKPDFISKISDWKNIEPDTIDVEEGFRWPTTASLERAETLLRYFCTIGQWIPTRVIPGGEGDVVFEYYKYDDYETIFISDKSEVSYRKFCGGKMVNSLQEIDFLNKVVRCSVCDNFLSNVKQGGSSVGG